MNNLGVGRVADRLRACRFLWTGAWLLSVWSLGGCALFGSIDATDYRVSSGDGSGAAGAGGRVGSQVGGNGSGAAAAGGNGAAGGGIGGGGVGGGGSGAAQPKPCGTVIRYIVDDADDAELHRDLMGGDPEECIDGCISPPDLLLNRNSQVGFRFRDGLGLLPSAITSAKLRFSAVVPITIPNDTINVDAWEPGVPPFDDSHDHDANVHGAILSTEVVQAPTDPLMVELDVAPLISPLMQHPAYAHDAPIALRLRISLASSFDGARLVDFPSAGTSLEVTSICQ